MEELKWCIDYLSKYNNLHQFFNNYDFNTFRSLLNITMPISLSKEFYLKQDKVLKQILSQKTIIDVDNLSYKNNISIYKGDITLLKCEAIVNAGNEKLLGCFYPLHNCIDNAIHSFAGLQVRKDLIKMMNNQDEENGKCKVTNAYNLPAKYIFHTVGPKVFQEVTKQNEIDLRNCYLSCLTKAQELHLSNIVFPCISTGVYNFPKEKACLIAFQTVKKFLKENDYKIKVIFNVFSDFDYLIYKKIEGETNDN